ncbi:MAG: hypothetical protein F2694_09060 [Actinobacteria bacterium]|nr:hypothetical protein [Actinomycetota bacterium]MSY79785.1 hypothetical protein [Actinomycetota bacterium]MTA62772.1 hypothetical protein [Actinomycetota bacterium]
MAKRGPKSLSPEHKAAMAEGRTESRLIKSYLEAIRRTKPTAGRPRTSESVNNRINKVNQILDSKLDPLKRLSLLQERIDLAQELKRIEDNSTDLVAELEPDFIIAAKSYSERKGISYAAWREFGVPASVLKAAGISRVAPA